MYMRHRLPGILDFGWNVFFSVNSDTSFRMLWNAGVCSGFQSNVLYLSEIFRSFFNVNAVFPRLEMYLVRWCFDPMMLFSCLNVLGMDNFSIASVFCLSVNGSTLLIL